MQEIVTNKNIKNSDAGIETYDTRVKFDDVPAEIRQEHSAILQEHSAILQELSGKLFATELPKPLVEKIITFMAKISAEIKRTKQTEDVVGTLAAWWDSSYTILLRLDDFESKIKQRIGVVPIPNRDLSDNKLIQVKPLANS